MENRTKLTSRENQTIEINLQSQDFVMPFAQKMNPTIITENKVPMSKVIHRQINDAFIKNCTTDRKTKTTNDCRLESVSSFDDQ